jgi:hypothetical protein
MNPSQSHRSFVFPCRAILANAAGPLVALIVLAAAPQIAVAEVTASRPAPVIDSEPANESASPVFLFPEQLLYPPYVADPHRNCFGVQYLHFTDVGISDAGNSRFGLKAGGRFGLMRFGTQGQTDRGWQLDVEGGLNAQFDVDYDLDAIGWEGKYGLMLSTKQSDALAVKLGINHISSHVGDEYAERTGRLRIGYTRHELVWGMSYAITARWRAYVEAGWGYDLKNDILQEPGRVQTGLEYEGPRTMLGGSSAWYAAVDAASWQERDWRVDVTVQSGIVVHRRSRTWRIGVEYHNGRPTLGEFFRDSEEYISAGLWIDV